MLLVPAETIRILNKGEWKKWQSIKEARFEMKYNPKHRGSSFNEKMVRYEDVKNWHKILGKNSNLDNPQS